MDKKVLTYFMDGPMGENSICFNLRAGWWNHMKLFRRLAVLSGIKLGVSKLHIISFIYLVFKISGEYKSWVSVPKKLCAIGTLNRYLFEM